MPNELRFTAALGMGDSLALDFALIDAAKYKRELAEKYGESDPEFAARMRYRADQLDRIRASFVAQFVTIDTATGAAV